MSHSTPRESYQCHHCEKTFAFKNSLKKHLEKGRCDVLKRLQKDANIHDNESNTIINSTSTNSISFSTVMTEDLDLLR